MKRFVVELLVEDTYSGIGIKTSETILAAQINLLCRHYVDPLQYKVVGFSFRKEAVVDEQASSQ